MYKNYLIISLIAILASMPFADKVYSSEWIKYKITPGIEKGTHQIYIEPFTSDEEIPEACLFTHVEMEMSIYLKPVKIKGKLYCHILIEGAGSGENTYTIHVLYNNKNVEIVKLNNSLFK